MTRSMTDKLSQDHRDLDDLLEVVDRQLRSLRGGGSPNFEVMAAVIGYLSDQSMHRHHDLERSLLTRLAERSPEYQSLLWQVEARRHHACAQCKQFRGMIESVLEGCVVPRPRLVDAGRECIRACRSLIAREEAEVFPLLALHLRPSDCLPLVTACHWNSGTPPAEQHVDGRALGRPGASCARAPS